MLSATLISIHLLPYARALGILNAPLLGSHPGRAWRRERIDTSLPPSGGEARCVPLTAHPQATESQRMSRTTNAPAARSSTEATRLPPLRPLPPSRVRWEGCDPGTLFPWCLSQAWTTTCHGRLGPPEPASPPRSHPALAHHRGDALWILAAAGVVKSDHPAAPHLAVRRRRPRHARDRRPMEDRMAEHPAPRR